MDVNNVRRGDQFKDMNDDGNERKNLPVVIPVVVNLVKTAKMNQNENFEVFGYELKTVSLCCRVMKLDTHPQKISFLLADGSGEIGGDLWGRNLKTDCVVGNYVFVVGQLREWKNEREIIIDHVRKLEDDSEMVHHYMNVIYVYSMKTKGKVVTHVPIEENQPDIVMKDDDLTLLIRKYIIDRASMNERTLKEGVLYTDICKEFGNRYIHGDIKKAIKFLLGRGSVYTVHDDSHFLCHKNVPMDTSVE